MPGTADWGAQITQTSDQEHHHRDHHHLAHHQQRQKRMEMTMMVMVGMAMRLKHLERLQKPMTVAMETIWM